MASFADYNGRNAKKETWRQEIHPTEKDDGLLPELEASADWSRPLPLGSSFAESRSR